METFSALLAICAGNSPVTGEFPAQRPVKRSGAVMFFFVICAWIKGWVNNRDAGDLRCHCAHYDVNVIKLWDIHCEYASYYIQNHDAIKAFVIFPNLLGFRRWKLCQPFSKQVCSNFQSLAEYETHLDNWAILCDYDELITGVLSHVNSSYYWTVTW